MSKNNKVTRDQHTAVYDLLEGLYIAYEEGATPSRYATIHVVPSYEEDKIYWLSIEEALLSLTSKDRKLIFKWWATCREHQKHKRNYLTYKRAFPKDVGGVGVLKKRMRLWQQRVSQPIRHYSLGLALSVLLTNLEKVMA